VRVRVGVPPARRRAALCPLPARAKPPLKRLGPVPLAPSPPHSQGLGRIDAPTSVVWVIGRTQVGRCRRPAGPTPAPRCCHGERSAPPQLGSGHLNSAIGLYIPHRQSC
jgi:hypothetical protein